MDLRGLIKMSNKILKSIDTVEVTYDEWEKFKNHLTELIMHGRRGSIVYIKKVYITKSISAGFILYDLLNHMFGDRVIINGDEKSKEIFDTLKVYNPKSNDICLTMSSYDYNVELDDNFSESEVILYIY
jgi:hypothetical protein